MSGNPKCWRDLQAGLRRLGACPVRTRGSHEVWRFPDGEVFLVICNHPSDSVPVGIVARFRQLRGRRRRGGVPLGD